MDLRRLEFIDCAGAHLLIEADRRIRHAGGWMAVVRGEENTWCFDLLGLGDLLELCDPPLPVRTADGYGRAPAVIEALRRQYPDAVHARLATTAAHRDELRGRVAAPEHELLDCVRQPPAHSGATV